MNMSLNNVNTLVQIPLRDIETGEESELQCHPVNLLGTVINTMRNDCQHVVLREKMELTLEERLVLEHEDILQRIRTKIDYFFIHYEYGLGLYSMTPERHHYKQLKLLLKIEEPNWIPLLGPRFCAGCGESIPAGEKALRVRVRAENKNVVCCGYNCFGLMLAAGQSDGH